MIWMRTRVIAADLDGSIWVFSVRDKRDCKVRGDQTPQISMTWMTMGWQRVVTSPSCCGDIIIVILSHLLSRVVGTLAVYTIPVEL